MSLDSSFKRGTVRDPLGMLFLAGRLGLDSDALILPCDREIIPPHKFADTVFRVEERDGRVTYEQLEALARWHVREPEAITLRFGALIQLPERQGAGLHVTVVLLNEKETPAELPREFRVDAEGGAIVVWPRYLRVWEMDGDAFEALGRDTLLPWVALMRTSEPALKRAASKIAAKQDEDLGSLFVTLGGVRYNKEYLRHLLGRFADMLTPQVLAETPLGQELVEIGMEKGFEKGRRQEAVDALRLYLANRYPALTQQPEVAQLATLPDPHAVMSQVFRAADENTVWAIITDALAGSQPKE